MTCPNCSYEIQKEDQYCVNCGQKNKSLKISLKDFLGSFFQEYLSFDTRFFRSIGPLLFKPGFLADRFFEGKRLTYVNPLRFYIFVSFIGFLLVGFSSMDIINVGDDQRTEDIIKIDPDEDVDVNSATGKESSVKGQDIIDSIDLIKNNRGPINRNFTRYFSFALFLLMPIFALITYLLFLNRKEYYLQHLILSFHIHTFFFILLILSLLSSFLIGFDLTWLVVLLLTVYTIFSMRNYYKCSWIGTIWRFVVTILLYNIALIFVVIGVIVLSLYFSDASQIFELGSE